MTPQVSVVVPTCRRPALLARCLDALVAQRFDPEAFEIVVVDDAACAKTEAAVQARAGALASSGPRIRYLRPEGGHGPAVARNCGWRHGAGDIVAFTDDDTIPDRDWLAAGVRAIEAEGPRIAAVAGRVRVPPGNIHAASGRVLPPTDHELMTRGLETAEFVTANAFVRRAALVAVGGFDERFRRPWREDSDLQFSLLERAGDIGRCREAVVVHPVRREPWGVSLRQQKNVYYDALLFKKHPTRYRERILAAPPWDYYAIVVLSIVAAALWVLDVDGSALIAAGAALVLVLAFAARRLRHTVRTPAHVVEMIVTSAAIPFLSVYWRLRGALRFRVAYF